MKKFKSLSWMCLFLGLLVLLTGCPESPFTDKNKSPKGMMYFSFFDTVSYVYSYAGDSQKEFEEKCESVSVILEEYHRLFDIYYEYSGITNLRTINLNAGGEPLIVDDKLIEFLLYVKDIYQKTNGETNVMMGAVLKLWHDCREQAAHNPSQASIPTEQELIGAYAHTDISFLEIDEQNKTVRISDPNASIDVGAIGKGYATEKAAQYLYSINATSYVLNIGGNIRIIGHKPDNTGWKTGVKNPFNTSDYSIYLNIADTSCVTSGDYERYFTVGNERYHHIIDKDTLMPSNYFSLVTVITKDSGLADALSTALFTMSYEDGLALVNSIGEVEVFWVAKDGTHYKTEGLSKLIVE